MTATTHPVSRSAATRSPQWVRMARQFLRLHGRIGVWTLITCAVVAAVVLTIVGRSVTPQISGIQFIRQPVLWVPFSINIVLATAVLPFAVANGMTRRSFVKASLVTSAVVAVASAVAVTLLLVAERGVYDRLGWFQGSGDGDQVGSVAVLASGVGSQLGSLCLLYLAGTVCGLLVGASYLRFGAWATLMLPLTVGVPLGTVTLLSIPKETQASPWDLVLPGAGAPGWLAVGLVVIALTGWVYWLITRDVTIKTKAG